MTDMTLPTGHFLENKTKITSLFRFNQTKQSRKSEHEQSINNKGFNLSQIQKIIDATLASRWAYNKTFL